MRARRLSKRLGLAVAAGLAVGSVVLWRMSSVAVANPLRPQR